jgi:predicted nucleic acid-binding protein
LWHLHRSNYFIHVSQIEGSDQRIVRATNNLDDGEKEVILLAASLQEDVVLLLDDQAGRRIAQELGFVVLGTAGCSYSQSNRASSKPWVHYLTR